MKFVPLNNQPNISISRFQSVSPSMVLDERGHPHIAWLDTQNGHNEVKYSFWDGLQWTDPVMISESENIQSSSHAIEFDFDDHINIVYSRKTPTGSTLFKTSIVGNTIIDKSLNVPYNTSWVGIFKHDRTINFSSSSSSSTSLSSVSSNSSSSSVDSSSSSSSSLMDSSSSSSSFRYSSSSSSSLIDSSSSSSMSLSSLSSSSIGYSSESSSESFESGEPYYVVTDINASETEVVGNYYYYTMSGGFPVYRHTNEQYYLSWYPGISVISKLVYSPTTPDPSNYYYRLSGGGVTTGVHNAVGSETWTGTVLISEGEGNTSSSSNSLSSFSLSSSSSKDSSSSSTEGHSESSSSSSTSVSSSSSQSEHFICTTLKYCEDVGEPWMVERCSHFSNWNFGERLNLITAPDCTLKALGLQGGVTGIGNDNSIVILYNSLDEPLCRGTFKSGWSKTIQLQDIYGSGVYGTVDYSGTFEAGQFEMMLYFLSESSSSSSFGFSSNSSLSESSPSSVMYSESSSSDSTNASESSSIDSSSSSTSDSSNSSGSSSSSRSSISSITSGGFTSQSSNSSDSSIIKSSESSSIESTSSSIDSNSSSSSFNDDTMYLATIDTNNTFRIYSLGEEWKLVSMIGLDSDINFFSAGIAGKQLGVSYIYSNLIKYNFLDLDSFEWNSPSFSSYSVPDGEIVTLGANYYGAEEECVILVGWAEQDETQSLLKAARIRSGGLIQENTLDSYPIASVSSPYISNGYRDIAVSNEGSALLATGARTKVFYMNGGGWTSSISLIDGISEGIIPKGTRMSYYDGTYKTVFSNNHNDIYYFENDETLAIESISPQMIIYNEHRLWKTFFVNGAMKEGQEIMCTYENRTGQILREAILPVVVSVNENEDPLCNITN